MSVEYIKVSASDEDAAECIELDVDIDGTISIEALKLHFGSSSSGLKYRNPETNMWRYVHCKDGKMQPLRNSWLKTSTYSVCYRSSDLEGNYD